MQDVLRAGVRLALWRAERDEFRWAARRLLWSHSSLDRLRCCGRLRTSLEGGVELGTAGDAPALRGVQRCASIWACASCQAKIRAGRAEQIAQAGTEWVGRGGSLLFLTLTVPHDQGDRLAPLLDSVAQGWRRVSQSHAWRRWKAQHGIAGYVRALEVTVGPNGWHPHLHVLVFVEDDLSEFHRELLHGELHAVWASWAVSQGWRAPSLANGVRVDRATNLDGLGAYLAKVGADSGRLEHELARPDLKIARSAEHRSPMQLLRDLVHEGDTADRRLWWEYEAATFGRRAITWSVGLRDMLGVGDVSDQQLAEAEVGFVARLTLEGGAWRTVCDAAQAWPVVRAVHDGDEHQVLALLVACGVDLRLACWHPPD